MKKIDWEDWQVRLRAAYRFHELGEDAACWYELLMKEFEYYRPEPTEKQKRQQKLASQLWRLTGVYGQLRQMTYEFKDRKDLYSALAPIAVLIETVKEEMKSL